MARSLSWWIPTLIAATLVILTITRSHLRLPRWTVSIPILVYHSIGPLTESRGELTVSPEMFERQLAYLADNGYQTISFATLVTIFARQVPPPEKAVIITFDDAWENQLDVALPLLKRYGFTATFFPPSGVLGGDRLLTANDLRELHATGMEIGGHGKMHVDLTRVDREQLYAEIHDDKTALERIIGSPISVFAYPFGTYNDAVIAAVQQAGYAAARAIGPGVMHSPDGRFTLTASVVTNDFPSFTKIFYHPHAVYQEFSSFIAQYGEARASAYAKTRAAREPPGYQHSTMHIFGEALYETAGMDGIRLCDGAFIFGCYHGFIGRAITDKGIGIVGELGRICDAKNFERLGCHHGIGHGIMTHFGDNRLIEALQTCAALSWHSSVGGCTGGLWMEYNFQNAHETGEAYIRPFDGKNPYAPCDALPDPLQASCYYEQPDWWADIFKNDFNKLGELCADAPTSDINRDYCFIGIGRIRCKT